MYGVDGRPWNRFHNVRWLVKLADIRELHAKVGIGPARRISIHWRSGLARPPATSAAEVSSFI